MKRISTTPRPNLSTRIADLGFEFASMDDGQLYWDETLRYEFTLEQIEQDLEAPTNELWGMCLEVAARAAADGAMLTRLGVPAVLHERVAQSWHERQPSLYGRFDFAYDGHGSAKMLELNADTPTSLYEAAVFQWHWLEDCRASGALPNDADQFNSLHERLIARWRQIAPTRGRVHMACMDNTEDRVTAEYVADTAAQAGLQASCLTVREIGLRRGRLIDAADAPIDMLFKLYPWEWLIRDAFGTSDAVWQTRMVEPAWKMMLSTKALLVELWRLFPGHPNLLATHGVLEPRERHPLSGTDYVLKPIHAREGANVMVLEGGSVVAQIAGSYDGPLVAQARAANLFRTVGGHAIVGSWIVGDQASGIGMREDAGLITTNTARFVPHAIVG